MEKTTHVLLAALALLLLPISVAHAQSVDRSGAHWTMTRLDIDVFPDFEHHVFRAVGEARLRLDGAAASAGPTLRLGHDVTAYSQTQTEFVVFDALSGSGRPTITLNRPSSVRGVLEADIRYARPKRRGQSITIRFEVRMTQPSFTSVVTDRVALASSGTGWYPIPIAAGDADAVHESSDPADDVSTGLTRIHLPRGFYSFSTGVFASRREGADTVETWRKDGTRTRGFVAGAYQRATRHAAGIDVYVYGLTPAMNPDALSEQVGIVANALTARYGPYPYHQYAAAEISNEAVRWWGLADGDYQVLRTSLVEIGGVYDLAHEMAHAWWGNLIEQGWPGGYLLGESMAEYSAMIAYGDVLGPEAFQAALALRQTIPGTPPDYTMPHFFQYLAEGHAVSLSEAHPNGTNYEIGIVKGSRVLHMLRMRVGDEVFFSTLRRLLQDNAHGTASAADLRTAFIAAAPDRDLPQFFSQWLDRPGAPAFDSTIECRDDGRGGKINRVTLTQFQSGEPYVLDLDIQLTGAAPVDAIAHVRGRETLLDVPATSCLSAVELNPARDLFIWRPEYGHRPS